MNDRENLKNVVHDLYIDFDIIETLLLKMNLFNEYDQLLHCMDELTKVFMKMEVYKDVISNFFGAGEVWIEENGEIHLTFDEEEE